MNRSFPSLALKPLKPAVTRAANAMGLWSWTRRYTIGVPRLFLFHRFSAEPAPGTVDSVTFAGLLDRISAQCEMVTVSDLLAKSHARSRRSRPLAAITVDDGYRDFYDHALPLLKERNIPATLYATAAFIDGRHWLWWDALRYILAHHPSGSARVMMADRTFTFELSDDTSRSNTWTQLANLLVKENSMRQSVIEQLSSSAKRELPDTPTPDYAAMTWKQLKDCLRSGIEIGNHTMTHAYLPGLTDFELERELNDSKDLIEQQIGQRTLSFAYPNGMPYDWTSRIARTLKRSGFKSGVLAYPKLFRRSHPFAIGRWSALRPSTHLDNILSGASVLKMQIAGRIPIPHRRSYTTGAKSAPELIQHANQQALTEYRPLVSVVVATYNMGQYIADAIDSILDQTYTHIEVIVVDDGSTDSTQAVLGQYAVDPRVRVVSQQNQGQPKAKNAGIQASTGELVGFCDADDRWLDNKLELQVPLFARNPAVGIVYSDVMTQDASGEPLTSNFPPAHRGYVLSELFVENIVPFGTALVRRKCFDTDGMFDESIPMGIDWDLWLRLATSWDFDYVSDATYVYRIWDGQMSKNWRGRYDCALVIMENFLASHPDLLPDSIVRRAYADTYMKLASQHLHHVGTAQFLRTILTALHHDLSYWPAWRLLLLAPWRLTKLLFRSNSVL